ncbi:hypothetical protein Tsubulata_042991 [Turnera subulata]|uniref:DUF4283 domain-containing protein n=1 Tax=Turnera subulata TaxID=218843 RepID=A0A9Q0GGD8_9ROSI|nr:hypothetical protein Tsubulata_042991 [Turnera subulata]
MNGVLDYWYENFEGNSKVSCRKKKKRRSSSLEKLDFSTAVLPTWVQLQNVPFELLTREGLSYLASAIGVPLHADQDCSKIFNGNSVNLCIEVDYSMPLKHELVIDINGNKIIIPISYSWKHHCCDLCKTWGHYEIACPKKKAKSQWIPKANSNPTVDPVAPTSTATKLPSDSLAEVSTTADPIVDHLLQTPSVNQNPPVPPKILATLADSAPQISAPSKPDPINASSSSIPPQGVAASPRRPRAASAGVATLMQQLQPAATVNTSRCLFGFSLSLLPHFVAHLWRLKA